MNQGADWFCEGTTPLMVAAQSLHGASVETVRLLLELGADPRAVSVRFSAAELALGGWFPGVAGGDAARARALLDVGSPVRTSGEFGTLLLASAARTGNCESVSFLLAHGASPQCEWPGSPTDDQVKRYSSEVGHCRWTFAESKLNTKRIGPYAVVIPLFQAAESGSAECVRLLLGAGARASQRDQDGNTALFHAANAAVVRVLCEAGVDPNAGNLDGDDALDSALRISCGSEGNPYVGAADEILRNGAPLMRNGYFEMCRLSKACESWNLESTRFLLDRGHPACDAAFRSACNHSAFDTAANTLCAPVISLLAERGSRCDSIDTLGNTPLHVAATAGGTPIGVAVETLLRLGADPNRRNDAGETPLVSLYSRSYGYHSAVPQLLAGGANPLIADNYGMNAIDHARSRIEGEEPPWRIEQWEHAGKPIPMGWKHAAEPDDPEYQMLELLERAAEKFR